jgi:hypothetical protein
MGSDIVATVPSQQVSFLCRGGKGVGWADVLFLPAVCTGIARSRFEDIRSSSAEQALEQHGLGVHYTVRHCQELS